MVAVSAVLVGTSYPQAVQVAVTGLAIGQAYEIQGQWETYTWPVRAGVGMADASQVVRADLQAPINVPVTYSVTVDGTVAATSAPITVPFTGPAAGPDGKYVLTALDGSRAAAFSWQDNGDPRDPHLRAQPFLIPGRTTPVVMYDVPAGEDGAILADTEGEQTAQMRAMVRAGGPLLLRTDGTVRDLAPVQFIHLLSAPSALTRTLGNRRRWTLGFTVLSDPEPNTLLQTSTWDDFDAAYSSLSWNDFDTEWAGSTWDQWDLEDWSTRA